MFAPDNRNILTIACSKRRSKWLFKAKESEENPDGSHSENFLEISPREISLKSEFPSEKQFGFSLEKDGVELYNLLEEHWLILGDYSKTDLNPKTWLEEKLYRVLECIPKKDIVVGWVRWAQSEIDAQILKDSYLKFFPLKTLIGSNPKDPEGSHLCFHPLSQDISPLSFERITIESFRSHLVLTAYENMGPSAKSTVFHFSKSAH